MSHDEVVICDQGICDYDPPGTGDHATIHYTYTGFLETDAPPFTAAFLLAHRCVKGTFLWGTPYCIHITSRFPHGLCDDLHVTPSSAVAP